jgi:hypothetical protein
MQGPRVIDLVPGETVVVRCKVGTAVGGRQNTRKNRKNGEAPTRKVQEGGKKKRSPNGYMKFAAKMRPEILKENPDMRSNVVAVARKIGEAWRKLPEAERKKY